MEVVVKMEGYDPNISSGVRSQWQTLMLGRFAMVCRDSKTQKARKVPRLIVETEEEKALWRIGEGKCDFLIGSRTETYELMPV
jgi:acyl-coenzyme A thioesterase 9